MFQVTAYSGRRDEDQALVLAQLQALIEGEPDPVANLANAAALLAHYLTDINWVGFYRVDTVDPRTLVLGPFHGLPACVRIPFGKGVCGTAAADRRTVNVRDVHQFPGHIACDAASASEIVVPLIREGLLLGVLDIDSPKPARFDAEDVVWLERFAQVLSRSL